MTTETKTINEKIKYIMEICPYNLESKFVLENFISETGSGYSRHMIETINRLRKIDSILNKEQDDFERKKLIEEKVYLEEYIESQNKENLEQALVNWQEYELDYWTNYLGKSAAIELLTYGKPTIGTMNKLVRLPEDSYIKATQICVRLANAIKQATIDAESAIGINMVSSISPSSAMRTPNEEFSPNEKFEEKPLIKKLNIRKTTK